MPHLKLPGAPLILAACAIALSTHAASAEPGKDWFGRPLEACEPKCHWHSWLGREHAPNMEPRPEAAAGDAPQATPPARPTEAAAQDAAGKAVQRHAARRGDSRLRPRPPRWSARAPDLTGLAAVGAALPADASAGEESADPIAASFEGLAVLIVRSPERPDDPPRGLAATTPGVVALGDLEPAVNGAGLHLSQAVLDRGEGLRNVASGQLGGLIVQRAGSADELRSELAATSGLAAAPLAHADREAWPDVLAAPAPAPTAGRAQFAHPQAAVENADGRPAGERQAASEPGAEGASTLVQATAEP